MPHSYTANHLHVVFSTRERRNQISAEMQPRLWAYMAGVGRKHQLVIHEVGGHDNHAHVLLSLPASKSLSSAIQTLKAVSSKWIHEGELREFQWQEGFGSFRVSASNMQQVRQYIQNQQEHHRKISFEDEFRALLRRHEIAFDEKYVFG
jgi:putative transposase